ncbi:PEP-CTERM sorting domain-containing protein [Phenylobacterium sp.]|uniref:PEP-CTERM sorting domain-containing protein n=1 Tax=Phenylobacterium sp. TaxID=1871053 RepID=UPI00120A61DA|nr:PEP-CTERM sorting domain-containing protein [Phenylobacterium sp.]THD50567.1 MAG: PEP-CTERM sorting domain-containing protein [Phenylobacterium sp.]
MAASGPQAVVVDGSVTVQTGPFYEIGLTSPGTVDQSADIMLTPADNSSWQSAATGLGQFVGGIDISGNSISAIFGAYPTIGTFSYGVWHQVDLLLDDTTQQYSVALDGARLASGVAFCGTNGACNGAIAPVFGEILFDTFGGSGNQGYLDNLSVDSVPGGVPEPASWALMPLGFAGLGAGLRARRARVVLA